MRGEIFLNGYPAEWSQVPHEVRLNMQPGYREAAEAQEARRQERLRAKRHAELLVARKATAIKIGKWVAVGIGVIAGLAQLFDVIFK